MASKGVEPLPSMRGSALARGCDRDGRVVLPLARQVAVWTGLRVRADAVPLELGEVHTRRLLHVLLERRLEVRLLRHLVRVKGEG